MAAASLVENWDGQKAAGSCQAEGKLPDYSAFEDRHVGRENWQSFLGLGGRRNAGNFWQRVFLGDSAKMFIYTALDCFHDYLPTYKELCNPTGQA